MKNRMLFFIALTICSVSLCACPATAGNNVWTPMNNGMYGGYIQAIAINPSSPTTVYAGTFGGGVFVYTDSGSTCGTPGDVNGDGKIGLEEVIYILQKIAGLR